MKRYLLTACMALASTTAFAADPVGPAPMETRNACSGHVEAYLGGITYSGDVIDDDVNLAYGGAARANCNFYQRLNVQGDLFAGAFDQDGDTLTSYGAAAHVFWRDSASYAVGVFGTISKSEIFGTDYDQYAFGPEVQLYLNNLTFYAQAEYGNLSTNLFPLDFDFWTVRGVVRYFATENLRFDAELAYRDYDGFFFLSPPDTFTAALQANYRFDTTPYTVFARYQYDQLESDTSSADAHKLSAGLRISFGSGTLLEEDRYGASMDTYRSNSMAY